MAVKRIIDFVEDNSPDPGDYVPIDNSTPNSTRRTRIQDMLTVSGAGLFATAAQGALADTALQPDDVGTAAAEDVGYFATAAQGAKADTLPAITADSFIVDNAAGTARESKSVPDVRGILGFYDTLADLQAATVRNGVTTIYVIEREAGFGGGSYWSYEASEPDVPALAKTQDAAGKWFRVATPSDNHISISVFGAKPGENGTAATQAALDFIEGLGGGVVTVPPPSSPFIMDEVKLGDYTTIRGIGWGVIHFILNPAAAVGANVVTNKNHTGTRNKSVKVIGLGIDGNRTNRASAADSGIRPGHCGILIVNTDNPIVAGNYVKSATLHGINISSDNETREGENVYKTTGVGTAAVTGNYVTDCGDDNITTHWSGKLIITENFSWAVAASHGDGSFCIEIDDGSEEFIVTGNHCWDALSGNSGGIAITSHEDTPAPRHGIVSGNNVRDCRRGIMCRDGGSITLPTASANARNIIITGNNVRNCREFHINVGTYENVVIGNNIITGGEFASEANDGIYLTANLRNVSITGNVLTNFSTATYAINMVISPVAPAGYITITGNKITNTTRGIRANRPGLIITGNVIEAGTSATFPTGIFTDASTADSVIANNVIKGFTTKVAGTWAVSSVVENNVG